MDEKLYCEGWDNTSLFAPRMLLYILSMLVLVLSRLWGSCEIGVTFRWRWWQRFYLNVPAVFFAGISWLENYCVRTFIWLKPHIQARHFCVHTCYTLAAISKGHLVLPIYVNPKNNFQEVTIEDFWKQTYIYFCSVFGC